MLYALIARVVRANSSFLEREFEMGIRERKDSIMHHYHDLESFYK